ncbi:sodium channel subunit beta-1-like isoform X2 [Cyprinus carpio]|uniref:Sodium channel regulatory subunit beta-3 n=2 Tax=Cyprinus carpio TaxID=7962 RepID=A0A8C1P3B8_CYPCA|nr:sodium channel subunit beta-1-like isoform X2 [Cyprinus carpio]
MYFLRRAPVSLWTTGRDLLLFSLSLCFVCVCVKDKRHDFRKQHLSSMKMSALRLLWVPVLLNLTHAWLCHGACVEVDSDTEAVIGKGFKLGCISCKKRGEVPAFATVDWWFMAKGESEFAHIYSYANISGYITDDRFDDRLAWNGSKKTNDVQDGSIFILNITFNDTGIYRCFFDRTLVFPNYKYRTSSTKFININVVGKATRGMASIFSEIMMYVSIIVLQLWLLVEMVYCYRKIAAAGEGALKDSQSKKSLKPKA